MALADEFDGFLVDLDGVVWTGREAVPGAVEALRELLEEEKGVVFVTNNPGKAAGVYAGRLREAGVDVGDEQVVTAGDATAGLVVERVGSGCRALVIGAPAFHETVAAAGLEPVRAPEVGDGAQGGEGGGDSGEIGAVIVSGHRGFDYGELLAATRALQGGASLFATSRDPTLPMPGGAWPGTGSVLAAVETASGATATIGGKPEPHLFELAQDRLRCSLSPNIGDKEQRGGGLRVAMVGDRVSSDIEGGRRAGLATILVLSGATSAAAAENADPPPDHIVADLAGLTL